MTAPTAVKDWNWNNSGVKDRSGGELRTVALWNSSVGTPPFVRLSAPHVDLFARFLLSFWSGDRTLDCV